MTIREAGAADLAAVARLHVDLGVVEPPPSLEQWPAVARDTLIYAHGDAVLGYVLAHAFDRAGHIHGIVVDAAARGTGVGEALMLAAAARFRTLGLAEWHLNVKVDNAPAIRLYERIGMTRRHASAMIELPWDALPAGEPGIVATAIGAADDAMLEHRFELLAGRLARARTKSSRALLQLRERGEVVGVGVFDPDISGFAPMRVVRPALVASLAVAVVRPSRVVRFFIENDAATRAMLNAAGGVENLTLIHYAAPL
ncbi:MAG TPA: GNAT family N-acetyltransferase [Kofleriaceae bacterium]|nr:GNAT family N-acetyltransferase [Kofleriaceae bacterium]